MPPGGEVGLSRADVVKSPGLYEGAVALRDLSPEARWDTHIKAPRWNHRTLWDQRARRHNRAFANARMAEQNSSHADETMIFNDTAMDNCPVSHRHPLADDRGRAAIRVQNRSVLNIAVGPDPYDFNITAKNTLEPHTCILSHFNVADHVRTLRNEC